VGLTIIIWILVFFGIFYFLAIRPQRRQRQQHSEMVSMLKKGDEVLTIGGMYGTITKIGDDWVELEVAKRTRVRYLKRAVSSITSVEEIDEEEDQYIEAGEDEEYVDEEYVDEEYVEEEPVDETEEPVDETADAVDDTEVTTGDAVDEPDAPEAPEAPKK